LNERRALRSGFVAGEILEGGAMKGISAYGSFVVVLTVLSVPCLIQSTPAQAQTTMAATQSKPAGIQIPNAPIPTRVLIQSPAETDTDLQIICLFESVPENTLHGSLVETNEKLKGLLDNLLIIGLGDAQTFTPQRLELVGSIAYNESNRLRVTHPFFAPTVLDGGVSKYTTGQESEEFITGFLRAARTEKILQAAGADKGPVIQDLTYLAGPTRATDTQQGIERGLAAAGR
jgi:hypothetical protein